MGTSHLRSHAATPALPLEAGVVFVNAFVSAVAEDHGIRYVVVKGAGVDQQGIRKPQRSTDVDVWVDPARTDEFLALLGSHGWHRRVESLSWTLFITHSITLVHDAWPCDIDVHRTFPGMLGDPRELFDEMWSRRERAVLHAGVTTWVPDRHSHAVVASLHALRAGRSDQALAQLADIAERIDGWSEEDRESIRDAAIRLRADAPMATLLRRWRVPVEPTRSTAYEAALWDIRRHAPDHTFDWLYAVATAPRHRRIALLKRGLLPTHHDITANHPTTRRSPWLRARMRVTRGLRGLGSLPQALLGLLRLGRLRAFPPAPSDPATPAMTLPEGSPRPAATPTPDRSRGPGSTRDGGVHTSTVSQPGAGAGTPCDTAAGPDDLDGPAGPLLFSNGDGTFLYNPHVPTAPPLWLSPTADLLWELLVERGLSPDETIDEVLARFDADASDVRASVDGFLRNVAPYRTT